jgi:hypothetical protein
MPRGAKMEVVPRSPRRDRGQFRSVMQANLTPAALSLALALGWLLLSWWHPTTTYHLGPPLVALAWPVLGRARVRHQLEPRAAGAAAFGGVVVALLAIGVAAAAQLLDGPTLIGRGNAAVEGVALTLVAGLLGWRIASRRRAAWYLPKEGPR